MAAVTESTAMAESVATMASSSVTSVVSVASVAAFSDLHWSSVGETGLLDLSAEGILSAAIEVASATSVAASCATTCSFAEVDFARDDFRRLEELRGDFPDGDLS